MPALLEHQCSSLLSLPRQTGPPRQPPLPAAVSTRRCEAVANRSCGCCFPSTSQLVSAPAGAWEQLLHLKRTRQLIHSVNRPKQVTRVPACSGQKHIYISHGNRLRTSSNPSSCTGIAHTSLHVDEHTSASNEAEQLHTTTLYLPLSLTELLTPAGWLCRPALYIQRASQPSWDRHRLETCVKQAGLVLKFLTCSFKSSLLSGKSF